MSDDLLARLPGLIAAAIRVAAPGLAECAPHAGRFDLAELRAFSARCPAVRVAALALTPAPRAAGPQRRFVARIAAFVVTRDAPALDRAAAAAALVQRIALLAEGARWGEADLGPAEGVEASNLYGAGARGDGVALWAVQWRQPLALEAAPTAPLGLDLYVSDGPGYGPAAIADYAAFERPPKGGQ